jgi:hypothetical protein
MKIGRYLGSAESPDAVVDQVRGAARAGFDSV